MADKNKEGNDAEQQIEIWKVKRVSRHHLAAWASPSPGVAGPLTLPSHRLLQLIKALDNARGNGTSMISLIMPPKSQVRRHRHPPAAAASYCHSTSSGGCTASRGSSKHRRDTVAEHQ